MMRFFLICNVLYMLMAGRLSLAEDLIPCKTFSYQEETLGKKVITQWTISLQPDGYKIAGTNPNYTVGIHYLPDLKCVYFAYDFKRDNACFQATNHGNKLFIDGCVRQKKQQISYDLKSIPWIQGFEFGLRPFLKAAQKSLKFCVIHPKEFDLHYLVATKESMEKITLHGKTYDAIKIKVTLPGFKSMFWKAMLWYDSNTHDLLMSQANRGPNTPTTTITFLSRT